MLAATEAAAVDERLPLEALGDRAVAREISPAAVRLFLRLADAWDLTVDQRRALLGGISRPTYFNWQRGRVGALSRDQLERISLVLGIRKGLRLLFADDAGARRWLAGPNTDIPFGGRSPLERMTHGGMDDLYAVRRYIDAWRGVK
jgi:hypothetical protein